MAISKYQDEQDFKEYELFPALYEIIDEVFPFMHFRRRGKCWESNYHLSGEKDSKGKFTTYVYENTSFCIQDKGQGNKGTIDFYMEHYGKDYREALEELSSRCGLTPPNYDSEESKQRRYTQDSRTAALNAFTSALWENTPQAKEVLDYLHSRNWTDEEIKSVELGLVTTEILNALPDSTGLHATTRDENDRIIGSIGTTHTLAIPFRCGSRLLGFKVREARKELQTPQKYLNTYGLQKSEKLFWIGTGIKDVTIVEGELDALHAQAKGLRSIAATTGGAATESQLQDAIERGAKRITLLYDNDEAGRTFTYEIKTDNRGKETEQGTLSRCEALGIPTFVASLPDGVKDVDEFFQKGHTIEELKTLIDEAEESYIYRYRAALSEYSKSPNPTPKDRTDFFAKFETIINSPSMIGNEGNRERLYRQLEADSEKNPLSIGMDEYRAYLDKKYSLNVAKKQKEDAVQASDKIKRLLDEGKVDEALQVMKETAERVSRMDRTTEYAKVFSPPSSSELNKLLSEIKEGLPTGYAFIASNGKRKEPLTLNVGLTFICGYRGHCKTSFLNNIALNEVRRQIDIKDNGGEAKSVLYFSYEIDKRRLIANLLNTFVNDPTLASKPLATIYSYFRAKTVEAQIKNFAGEIDSKGNKDRTRFNNFVQKKEEFFRKYISSGLLTVVDEAYKIEELLDAIKFQASARPVSLICIDYAQQIYSEAAKGKARYEEIKKIVNDIKDFANKNSIPFLLAAQFNRDVESPVSVDTKSIGEGGDLERIADTCIGLYNLKELHSPTKTEEKGELTRFLNKHRYDIVPLVESTINESGQRNSIPDYDVFAKSPDSLQGILFARLMKRRYGEAPLDAFLKWEGKTGHIEQNDEDNFLSPSTEVENSLIFDDDDKRQQVANENLDKETSELLSRRNGETVIDSEDESDDLPY